MIDEVEEDFPSKDQAEACSGVRETVDSVPRIKRNRRKLIKLFMRWERKTWAEQLQGNWAVRFRQTEYEMTSLKKRAIQSLLNYLIVTILEKTGSSHRG